MAEAQICVCAAWQKRLLNVRTFQIARSEDYFGNTFLPVADVRARHHCGNLLALRSVLGPCFVVVVVLLYLLLLFGGDWIGMSV